MREHAAGDGPRVEPVLEQDPCRVVGALPGTAHDVDLAITRELVEARAQLTEGMLTASGTCSTASSGFSRTSRRKASLVESQ